MGVGFAWFGLVVLRVGLSTETVWVASSRVVWRGAWTGVGFGGRLGLLGRSGTRGNVSHVEIVWSGHPRRTRSAGPASASARFRK